MTSLIAIGLVILFIWLFSGNGSKNKKQSIPSIDYSEPNSRLYNSLGLEAANSKEHTKAIEYYNKALSYKHNGEIFNNRARSKSEIADFDGAIEDYSKAIDLNQYEPLYLINRGIIYSLFLNSKLAIKDWEKAKLLGSSKAKELIEDLQKGSPASHFSIDSILNHYCINYLYHLTHKNNLSSIFANGLVSHIQAHKGLVLVDIADQEVNIRRNRIEPLNRNSIHDYVPFYFNPKNAMLFKRKKIQDDIIIIAVDRNLILESTSIFTDGNAASTSTHFYNSIENLTNLNWQCINDDFWIDYPDGKRMRCAEILVHQKVSIDSILKIYCSSASSIEYVTSLTRNHPSIAVEQSESLFFESYNDIFSDTVEEPLDDLPF